MPWLSALWAWLRGADGPGEEPRPSPDALFARSATLSDVKLVANLLNKHGVEYVLVGGYALYVNGLVRATGDVDILVKDTPDNNVRWIAALSELPDGAARDLDGEPRPFPADYVDAAGEAGVIRIYDAFIVDVLPVACGQTYDAVSGHIVTVDVDGVPIQVLDLEGLLLTKQGVRDKDRSDRQQIELALQKLALRRDR